MTSPYATPEESQAVMGQPASQAQMLVERMIEARQLDEQGISPGKYAQGLYQIAVELAGQQLELATAAKGVLRISGRKHDAWDRVHALVARAEGGVA